MHLGSINLPDLIIPLWRGTFECDSKDDRSSWDWAVLQDQTWIDHGALVADATPYLPGSFERPPRNPAEKINSRYKAWEFLLYFYGLCPALLSGILPDKYWTHFCKLVLAIRLLHQHSISLEQLKTIQTLLEQFVIEFEQLYYRRMPERIHFIRQSVHLLLHCAAEVVRMGPHAYRAQWTLERVIGYMGQEIRQPSQPYANLSQRGLRQAQLNALKAMIPDLEPGQENMPYGSEDIDDGYVLLRKRDREPRYITSAAQLIRNYLINVLGINHVEAHVKICRWARLRLPNGQIARSAWKEQAMTRSSVRMARNVKVTNLFFYSRECN